MIFKLTELELFMILDRLESIVSSDKCEDQNFKS